MTHKVLVFESDAAFASELRNELGKLGCNTAIVDDGNVGLQQASSERPDLILLSIELPRMNGFSVCNKLKKDPALKDVPLIIMSSESSDETFEQHRKLRTRAEDYVHKPIAFGELLQHIQSFVQLVDPSAQENLGMTNEGEAIVIDDEVSIDMSEQEQQDQEDLEGTQMMQRPSFQHMPPPSTNQVDPEMDSFADAAFGMLTGTPAPPEADVTAAAPAWSPPQQQELLDVTKRGRNGSAGHASEAPPAPEETTAMDSGPPAATGRPQPRGRSSAPPAGRSSAPPRPVGADPAELERVRAEMERAQSRSSELEKELGGARSEISKLQDDLQRGSKSDAESQKLQREVDELKAKIATGVKAQGGVSSREFLDLREALNKKDKEILSLKEALTKKDKEIYENRDKSLILERAKGELDDKVLATERELADAREKIEAVTADKDQAKKAGEDLKTRLGRSQADVEQRTRELAEVRTKQQEETAAHEAATAALAQEHAAALTAAAEDKSAALAQATTERETALADAKAQATKEKDAAVQTRGGELQKEADSKLAALHRAHQDELGRTKAEFERQAEQARSKAADEGAAALGLAASILAKREEDLEARRVADVAQVETERDERVKALTSEHADKIETLAADRDARIASLESDRDARIAELESDRDSKVASLEKERDSKVASLEKERDAKIASLEKERDSKIALLESERDAKIAALESDRDEKIAELQRDRDTRIAELESDRDSRISTIENDRDSRLAAAESRATRELAEVRAVSDAHKAASDEQIRSLSDELGELKATNAANEAKVAELEQNLSTVTAARDKHEAALEEAVEKISGLEKSLAEDRAALAETRAKLSLETQRANRAVSKWDNDKASLERAKDALAVALSQIEETDRSISE